ncbi:MAG: cytidylate kinase-like family protein [Acutalibacteraceae bacterium]|nr:cytidylate kinase-like family protein [Acutalibacteraceae bacterium]
MANRTIITIGRQFGSGGREVGLKLSERLGIKFYDKELLNEAARESGLSREVIEQFDERPVNSLLYSLSMGLVQGTHPTALNESTSLESQIYMAQFNAIRRIADTEDCIIIGRCADYVLRDVPDVMSVFIHAPIESRTRRIAKLYEIDRDKAKKLIDKKDKVRSSYYNFYSDRRWGASTSYSLTLDSSKTGIDGAAELIEAYTKIYNNNK